MPKKKQKLNKPRFNKKQEMNRRELSQKPRIRKKVKIVSRKLTENNLTSKTDYTNSLPK